MPNGSGPEDGACCSDGAGTQGVVNPAPPHGGPAMFTDNDFHARATMYDYNREARRALREADVRELTTIEAAPQRVRLPIPEWLKRAPFVLRTTPR